jgi:hypothetical protein
VIILDIFANFLVNDQKVVPNDWKDELAKLGHFIENKIKNLKKNLPDSFK